MGADASIVEGNKVRITTNVEATLSFTLVVTTVGEVPSTLSLPTIIKIVDCSNGNVITGGSWETNRLYTEITTSLTTDLPIVPYTFSKPDCGLYDYEVSGYGVTIHNNQHVRFISNNEDTLNFDLKVIALGKTPATKIMYTVIKIVNCSKGNIIGGSTW